MELKNFFKNNNFEVFCHTLISMRMKTYDRDNTILNALQFDNFEDFYTQYKSFFICYYNDEQKLFNGIFRVFISGQLSCISQNAINKDIIHEAVYEIVEQQGQMMKELLKKVWPEIYNEIIQANESNKLIFPTKKFN